MIQFISELQENLKSHDGLEDGEGGMSQVRDEELRMLTNRISELEDNNAALRRELTELREEGEEKVREYEGVLHELEKARATIDWVRKEVRIEISQMLCTTWYSFGK